MAPKTDFQDRYQSGNTPWELGRPDKDLIELVQNRPVPASRALEIGCGTGHNSIWLAKMGFATVGIDMSSLAIEQARKNAEHAAVQVRFECMDFIKDALDENPFGFAFDRGCFHTMDSDLDRALFATRLAEKLDANGLWLSIIGNDDAPPRKEGPPRRTAEQIVRAVEPVFEIQVLRASTFDSNRKEPAKSWQCLMKKRTLAGD